MSTYQATTKIKRPAVLVGAAIALLFGASTIALSSFAAEEDASAQGMRIVKDSDSRELTVDIEPLRDRYEVDEPIRFRVRGNEDFYVYLYTLDEKTGESLLIFPNEIERDNRYPGGRSFLIPNRTAEFYADEPGRERLVMVASTRDLDIPLDRLAVDKHFYSAKSVELEEMLSEKGIRIGRDGGSRDRDSRDDGMVVKHLELEVTGQDYSKAPVEGGPTALISTSRDHYRSGETFDLVFGANRDGWLHLYAVEPGGAFERLIREEVSADKLESLPLRAEAPYGWHKLVAVYSPSRNLARSIEDEILAEGDEILPPADADLAVAVHRVRVSR